MQAGVVTSVSMDGDEGSIITANGVLAFEYGTGQSLAASDDKPLPEFSGNHQQQAGCDLKRPRVGDALLVEVDKGHVVRWAYQRHYLDLVERRFGTGFGQLVA